MVPHHHFRPFRVCNANTWTTALAHLLCFAFLFDVVMTQVRLREEDILLVNRPVSVPFGRTVFLDPLNHLRIHVRPGDRCEVTVQGSGDWTMRPGRLSSSVFPCQFGPSQVKYSHFGGRGLSDDRVRLILRYDSATETLIVPFTLTFIVNFKRLEIVRKNLPITVHRLMGFSTPIDGNALEFAYDRQLSVCKVTVLSRASGLPRYGYVSNDTATLSSIDCAEFLSLGVKYKHHAQANSPNRDYIPMFVELLDRSGESLKQEYFQVVVNVTVGQENSPPEPSMNALFVMDSINQFVMTAITPEILSATDQETPFSQLMFNITQPLGPGEGAIVSTDDRNVEIASFFQQEINDLKIAYKPPTSDSNVKRMFQLELQIMDSDGLKSDPIPLMIVVEPKSTLAPVVTTNRGLQLMEGESRPLVSPQVLQISDENNLRDVKVFHIDGMRHGHLVLPAGRNYFTPDDLVQGSVLYQHDGSDTFTDNIIFKMTDGQNAVEFLFPVTIYPIDDQPPALIVNTGLELFKNGIAEVSQYVLSATDTDSDDSAIKYIIEPPYSREGILIKRQFQLPDNPRDWQYQNGIYETFVNEFTQEEIVQGKIFYRHVGGRNPNVVVDSFTFRLMDGGDPPSSSPSHQFVIKILPVDDQPPYLYQNIKLQLDVDESELVSFRRKNLRYTDDDSNDRDLKYKIIRHPFDTYAAGPADAGQIVYCADPDRRISQFPQSEVNHHKICYNPPSSELGITARKIQFEFSVEDVSGNILMDQRFMIDIHPIDNQPPEVTNAGLVVFENDNMAITPQMLDVRDPDTSDPQIQFIITVEPDHGVLNNRQARLRSGDRFNRNDIAQGHIIYRNSGEDVETNKDQFSLDVTDGIHFVPIVFRITVRPVDDEPPLLVELGEPGTLSLTLQCHESQSVMLRTRDLRASDRDTNSQDLTFIVQSPPNSGLVLVDGVSVDRFTQRDMMEGLVTYEHTGGEIGVQEQRDRFRLMLTDNGGRLTVQGNRISYVDVRVRILPVDNIAPEVILGPKLDVLEGDKAAILPFHLDARDSDTNDDDILCTILMQPQWGYVENIAPQEGSEKSRAGMPVSAFSIRNVRLGNINYVQSIHKGVEPTDDHLTFQCTDGQNTSPHYRLMIAIYPANDEEPEVHVREFTGSEGMEIRIDLPILNAVDSDVPADTLHFIITSQPSHGIIVQQSRIGDTPIQNFTMDDIKHFSTIMYQHDDSETREDSFTFTLTDGRHNVSKTVPIIIFPVDDETPRLVINNGLEIEHFGDSKFITNDVLKATDLDSAVPNITFIIRKLPEQGYLQKYVLNRKVNLTLNSNFTQTDIDNKKIEYVHTGIEGMRDLIKFDITDGLNPLIDRYFFVTVAGLDMIYPEVINRGLVLPEGGVATLTTDLLSGTDLNSPDEDLLFTITRAPKNGFVELSTEIGVPITNFTQIDLAASRVRYVHHDDHELKMDSFEFEVTDGFNPVSRTFRIALTDVDNKKPVLMFGVLRLKEGGSKLITPFELSAKDSDTVDNKLVFTITQVPLHGNLLYNYSRIVSRFTMQDLNNNLVSYQHDGTETMTDSFSFTVTDGTHAEFFVPGSPLPTRRPQELDIEILPVDNGVPQISINRGATVLTPLEEGGVGFQFTNKVLRSDDRDSPVDILLYTLTLAPKHGYIRNINRGDGGVITWTQGDIDRLQIQYVLHPGENATSDIFFFKVADNGNNVLANQPFHLNWAWISFETDQVVVRETEENLKVTLHRRGYLGETCFVTINVTGVTATVGEDVSRRYPQQVQFNPGQSEKSWKIRLRDDQKYEESETLTLQLFDPVSAVIAYPDVAMVTILDPEDESTVYIPEAEYRVSEKAGQLEIPVHRKGDVSSELVVICSTQQGTATGTEPNKVQSFSDYLSRPADYNHVVRFDKDEDSKLCKVMIVDDSLYEEEESFTVLLSEPMGGRLGEQHTATVVIEKDKSDEPQFYFGEQEYMVDESDGTLEVKVWKTGTDLSRQSGVTVRSRRTEPPSAEAGLDYVAVNRILDFAPGVMTQTVTVSILDDLGQPQLEGLETFELVLRMPIGGTLGEPNRAVIKINDTVSDMPKMEFRDPQYGVLEREGSVVAVVTRSGDIDQVSMVRCYTRQSTAEVMMDYEERPDTNASFVFFQPGEREAECRVNIVDDSIREEEETFRLVLGTPDSPTAGGATLGGQISTRIIIYDPEDTPVIKFEESRYTVNEPIIKGDMTVLRVPVIRVGDPTGTSEVRVSTKDGSARAGRDYNGFSRLLKFGPGVTRQHAEIEINYDREREHGESFSVFLSPDRKMIAEVKPNTRALIFIEEKSKLADVIFAIPPLVVSLRDYDDVEMGQGRQPIQGYPLVCVSPCDVKHPEFPRMGSLCQLEGINNTLTKFRWRVSAPSQDGVFSDLQDIESSFYFLSTRSITLDSLYFGPGSRVQCFARAVNLEGEPGKELGSQVVTVSPEEGLCLPRVKNSVGAEPFTAKLRYTGINDPKQPNKVRVSVTIPHRDGMLPVISTNILSNFEFTLSPDGFRLGQHGCSNLLDYTETPTQYGFITNRTQNPNSMGELEPYQFSQELRGTTALRFYRNLDLGSCMWEFVSYFDMSELVSQCGGAVQTDGQVLNAKQSYVSLTVPLYVSYIFHSPVATGGWQNFDLRTTLKLTFVYDTSILWQEGVASLEDEAGLHGNLYPTSLRIQDDGTLAVQFRTMARFRGLYVPAHPGSNVESLVVSPEHPEMTFTLRLLRSEPTFEQPEQTWEIVSDMAAKDYSGNYQVKLMPCTTSINQQYSLPVVCNPGDLVTFDLPIRFQQVSDPVPAEYSLNTEFHLIRKRDLWLSDGKQGYDRDSDAAFAPGDMIYGRVDVDPVQSLGKEFQLSIEKVFLCSGRDGYIPKYDPDQGQYGCVGESNNLQHIFRILDKGAPHTEDRRFNDVPFKPQLAVDDPKAWELVRQLGSDGFSFDSTPLFQVDSGRNWFLHTIYTIRSTDKAQRGRRSVEETRHLVRRDVSDVQGMGQSGRGTNMAPIILDSDGKPYVDYDNYKLDEVSEKQDTHMTWVAIIVGVSLLFVICLFVIVIFIRHRRKHSSPPPSPSGTITILSGKGTSRVIANGHMISDHDNTEV